jgi:sugar/nucleoside kinase (ribokinase family)
LKLDCGFIQSNSFPTGTVTVTLNEKGQPQYVIHENAAWDNIELNQKSTNWMLFVLARPDKETRFLPLQSNSFFQQ